MENKNQFYVSQILGGKIYRYVDGNGTKGRVHISSNKITPLQCKVDKNGQSFVVLDGITYEINSMQELDSINSALNNYRKSLNKIMSIPSEKIAKNNPDLYIKTLEAIIYAVTIEGNEKYGKISNIFKQSSIYNQMNSYSAIDACVKKMARIASAQEKLQNNKTKTNTQKEMI